ncbi:MAG: 2-aminoethylphosphonate--pyruvate transaminase [Marinifilaceae bacterium]
MNRPYILLTPGPLTTSERVKSVMMADWCTWDKDYNENIVQRIRGELLNIAGTDADRYTTVLLQGSGTYAVEAAISCCVKGNDKLLVVANGAYGDRIGEIAAYHGLNHTVVALEETIRVTPEMVDELLRSDKEITHVAVVHCETTTGILNPIEDIAGVVKGHGKVFIVDAMSSFGGIPINVQGLDIDVLISSANKCIQGVPGFGFIVLKKTVLEDTKGASRSLSLDIYEQCKTMDKGEGKWRFTSPTHVVRAFAEALEELKEEGGVEARYQRYKDNHATLVKGMMEAGFTPLLPTEEQAPIITSFVYPSDTFCFETFYYQLKDKGFVIYPGKISKQDTFRIGNIGDVFPTDFAALTAAVKSIGVNN